MLDRELKKGSAELIILSIVEPRARHGYEISKLIEQRSAGQMRFHVASLYPLLYRLEERGWLQGRWVEKAGERRRRFYGLTAEGRRVLDAAARDVEGVRPRDGAHHRGGPCLTGSLTSAAAWPRSSSGRCARPRSSRSCRSIWINATRSCEPAASASPRRRAWSPRSCWSRRHSPASCGPCGRRTCPRRSSSESHGDPGARPWGRICASPHGRCGGSPASPRRPS